MRKYDAEFMRQAVKKILDGQSVASVSRELDVAEGILHNWKKARSAKSSSAEQEVLALKKRLKEVGIENEILSGSLRESSAEEAKRLCFYLPRKN